MSLQFVVGPTGAGKSTYVYDMMISESLKHPDVNYLLIVPDQFTMQTQMDIVKRHPSGGIMNIDVLSFSRLCYRIFEETGKPEYPVLDDTGKSLVLRTVASKISDKMPYLGKNMSKVGYIHEIKSSISEFMQYDVSVEDLMRLSEGTDNNLLKMKLMDLATVYKAFTDCNKEKFITNEETLDVLCNKLTDSVIIKKAVVIFDGFTGFTPIQENVIRKLSLLCEKIIVTLNLSHDEDLTMGGGEEKLFYLSRKTAHRLEGFATEDHVPIEKQVSIDSKEFGRFTNNPLMKHLERNLFVFPYEVYEGDTSNISIFKASDISSEVDCICNRIGELIRTGEYSYRDIAVVAGDFESYAGLFEGKFNELSMPCFIDRNSKITLNPFIEFLMSAMQIVIKDYSYDSVFHFLRSGFTDFDRDETDRFDRYVKSLNIRGKSSYHREFRRTQKGLQREVALLQVPLRNETREKLIKLLEPLEKPYKTVGEYVRAIYGFLTDNRSFERLGAFSDKFEAMGDISKALEYRQIYKLVMNLLDTMDGLLGDEEITFEEFYKIFEAGLQEIKVGIIPKGVDRIVVGDIERTRLNNIKVLFFAGVNDTNIPKNSEKGGILSSVERQMLSEKGFEMAPTSRDEMYTQRLYLYTTLCKPSHKLILSFACQDRNSNALRPAYLIENVRRLFGNLKIESDESLPLTKRMISVSDSMKYYAAGMKNYVLGRADEDTVSILHALAKLYEENGLGDRKESIDDAAFFRYVSMPLSREITSKLYSDVLEGSVSRFETYAKCAYEHYLAYGLRISENETIDFDRLSLGNVCHGILDTFFVKLAGKGYTFADFPEEEFEKLLDDTIEEYCNNYDQGILNEGARSAYIIARIKELIKRTVTMQKYQLSRGRFVPSSAEYKFFDDIDLGEGFGSLRLTGKIDRIDLCHEDDKVFVKITDYKSSAKKLDVTAIYHGISQQLVTYMSEAVKKTAIQYSGKEVVPSAMLYYRIQDPYVDAKGNTTDEELSGSIKSACALSGMLLEDTENIKRLDETAAETSSDIIPVQYSANGKGLLSDSKKSVLSAEEMKSMMDYVERMTIRIGRNIFSGDISASPIKGTGASGRDNTSCDYCPYHTVCGFDCHVEGFEVRKDNDVDADTAREIVMGGKEDGRDYLFNGSTGNN